MTAKVFHAEDQATWPQGFRQVAEIDRCLDADMAFRLTQHRALGLDHWADQPGVRCLAPRHLVRSTQTGDVVVLGDQVLQCLPIAEGWQILG